MKKNELPLGFGFVLAQRPDAMQKFSQLSEEERSQVLQEAHEKSSKGAMQSLVEQLSSQS